MTPSTVGLASRTWPLTVQFAQTSEATVGLLLRVLAAAVPDQGRILEIGTGCGIGTSWLVEGVEPRDDVEVITVEIDRSLVQVVQDVGWPRWVQFVVGDALQAFPKLGLFDLIFADAVAGKWHGLDATVGALRPHGVLVVDDMTPVSWANEQHATQTAAVREALLADPSLVAIELDWASGVIIAAKR